MQMVTAPAPLKPNGYTGDLAILRRRGVTRFRMGVLYMIVSSQGNFSLCFTLRGYGGRDILL